MKINYGNEQTGIRISEISVGETFFAERKSVRGKGLYMKADGNSGIIKKQCGMCYAINLETGQLRNFSCDALVDKVNAEVSFPRK